MTDNEELHVVFGTGAVGMAVMDELIRRGRRRVRMVNRSGRARVPDGVEVVGGDAHGHPATHGSSIAYFAVLVGLLGLFLGLLSKRTPLRVRLGMPWTKALRRAPYASHIRHRPPCDPSFRCSGSERLFASVTPEQGT